MPRTLIRDFGRTTIMFFVWFKNLKFRRSVFKKESFASKLVSQASILYFLLLVENPLYRYQFEQKKNIHNNSTVENTQESQPSQIVTTVHLNETDSTESTLSVTQDSVNQDSQSFHRKKNSPVVVKSLPTMACVGASKFFIQQCVLTKRAN